MRAALLSCLLAGCLSVPADPLPEPAAADGGTVSGDAVAVRCVPGTTLDLAYVSRIAVTRTAAANLSLDGLAVFANPGFDTIAVPAVTARALGGDATVLATAAMSGGEAGMVLAPSEAKGALSEAAHALVQAEFAEAWSDMLTPSLAEFYSLSDAQPDEQLWTELEIPIEVQAGDYAFAISMTLVDDESSSLGSPLAAARVSASCQ